MREDQGSVTGFYCLNNLYSSHNLSVNNLKVAQQLGRICSLFFIALTAVFNAKYRSNFFKCFILASFGLLTSFCIFIASNISKTCAISKWTHLKTPN